MRAIRDERKRGSLRPRLLWRTAEQAWPEEQEEAIAGGDRRRLLEPNPDLFSFFFSLDFLFIIELLLIRV